MESGLRVSRERLLVALLLSLDREFELLVADDSVLERFARASSWVRGKRVRVDEGGGYTGLTAGLDARGFLRIDGDDGVLHTVLSGGVRAF
jgi:BirA family biotin operon repressor/biotin-[acetyl-CoA-carboxylase] ligase